MNRVLVCVAALLVPLMGWAADVDQANAATQINAAEVLLKRAAEQNALWTSAQEALAEAKKYYADGKYAQVGEAAKRAGELANFGIGQTRYPLFSE